MDMVGCTISTKGFPTNSTSTPNSRYASASKGKIEATFVTVLAISLPRPLFQAQMVGAM